MNKKNKILYTIIFVILISIIFTLGLYSQQPRANTPRDLSVLISAEVQKEPAPSITLTWAKNELASTYYIDRKKLNDQQWSDDLATLDSNTTTWADNNVQVGEIYEYMIYASSRGTVTLTYRRPDNSEFDSTHAIDYFAFGYICTGIEVPPVDSRGKVLLLVDRTIVDAMPEEINRLEQDLITEGWTVVQKYVDRTETFDSASVKAVKNAILEEYARDETLNTVFILGRVAVPYAGRQNPDGHSNHIGAWPADLYYGYLNESFWTDSYIEDVSASRNENHNTIGDGKFDQTQIAGNVDLCVGRVDLYNLPNFTDSEYELLKKYLDKDHNYRTGNINCESRALVDDSWGAKSILEAFASSGWRNFGSLLGPNSTKNLDWFTTLQTDSYLWGYGAGGGSWDRAEGVGTTADFAAKPVNAVYTMLFGSYFGDWDSQNNFLRAPLASQPMALTCAWAARPHWYFHHMGMGFPIGYSTRLSQSNYTLYLPDAYYLNNNPNPTIYAFGMKQIHTALMRDPTLTMYSSSVPMPKNLSLVMPADEHVQISWEPPDVENQYYYNVYRSYKYNGPFMRINDEFLDVTNFTDPGKHAGETYYMVRTVQLEGKIVGSFNSTGSFYNLSRGIVDHLTTTGVKEIAQGVSIASISPNPAKDYAAITLSLSQPSSVSIEIYNLNGNLIRSLISSRLDAGSQKLIWNLTNLNNSKVAPGVYLCRLLIDNKSEVQKIVVLP